ncbi:transcription/translation regulatory transformer protein RfaH [Thalassotalea agarivorans]|uniref:transcription/translation regulatory transformer protein RfaH n=1 Tax=Thalassotalea agarivorans TaxID=349064 RepID=UPI001FE0A373|nr:transcription/translation regulatory transformer protein RfaH [Thalassotalea agarivorans]
MFNEKPGQWHVLTTKPKNEKRAHDNLKAQGFEVFLPLIAQVKKRQGLKSVAIEPLFPNYLFVKFNQKDTNFNAIRSTRGVGQLLRFGKMLATIDEAIIEKIAEQTSHEEQTFKQLDEILNYQAGDKVEINAGPFKGLEAIYKAKDGFERSVLLINLLGKEHDVSIETQHFDKIS